MLSSLFSAFTCVFARAALNVCDRKLFKNEDVDFLMSVAYNAVFPFLIAFSVAFTFGEKNQYFLNFLFQPGVILSALGAQLAAYMFSACFRIMPVKSIVVSSKVADLLIPLLIFCITSEFKALEYGFACLTTLIFVPIFLSILKNKITFNYLASISLSLILVIQAVINSYFSVHKFADTWPKFLSMMSCILLWRTLFILLPCIAKWIRDFHKQPDETRKVDYGTLFLRAFLAFISQAAFFYSITRVSGNVAWPILNSTPLVACFAAHILLKESVGKTELRVLESFILISFLYIYTHWSLLC